MLRLFYSGDFFYFLLFRLLRTKVYVIMTQMEQKRLDNLSPITYAYIGDAVFTLYVRARLAQKYDFKTDRLGKLCSGIVRASMQSEILLKCGEMLTEQERDIARRCRNTHTPSHAKNSSMSDYKRATALEGVLGYLYLSGQSERLEELESVFYDTAVELGGTEN